MSTRLRLFALLALLTCACRATRARQVIDQLPPTSVHVELVDVPQAELNACGLAALSALVAYYKVEIPPEMELELAQRAQANAGLKGEELKDALERLGFEVFVFAGELSKETSGLYFHLDARRPLLVMTSSDRQRFHYSLMSGYDAILGLVYLLDPGRGEIAMPTSEFEPLWQQAGRFTLVAVPRPPQA